MPNYYTLFSEELPVKESEVEWIEQVLKDITDIEDDDEYNKHIEWLNSEGVDLANTSTLADNTWPNFDWKIENGLLWIYSEETGCIESVAEFVKAFFKKFRPDDGVVIEWACTCSRPLIGSFNGGAVLVTAEHNYWFVPSWIAAQKQEELRANVSSNASQG